jgi:hypothetical protein
MTEKRNGTFGKGTEKAKYICRFSHIQKFVQKNHKIGVYSNCRK